MSNKLQTTAQTINLLSRPVGLRQKTTRPPRYDDDSEEDIRDAQVKFEISKRAPWCVHTMVLKRNSFFLSFFSPRFLVTVMLNLWSQERFRKNVPKRVPKRIPKSELTRSHRLQYLRTSQFQRGLHGILTSTWSKEPFLKDSTLGSGLRRVCFAYVILMWS